MKIYDRYYNYHNFATFLVRIKKKPKNVYVSIYMYINL